MQDGDNEENDDSEDLNFTVLQAPSSVKALLFRLQWRDISR